MAKKKQKAKQTDVWGFQIPDGTWDIEALGNYAQEQQRSIHGAEKFATPFYWRLGRALDLARRDLGKKTHFKQFLADRGIHKVRASKARTIAGFYKSPEDVVNLTVHEAYEAVLEDRRKERNTEKDSLQEEVDKDDIGQDEFDLPPIPATLTGKLAAVNDQLNRWMDAVDFDGLHEEDTTEQVTAEIEKAIATLTSLKAKLSEPQGLAEKHAQVPQVESEKENPQ